MLIYTSFAMLGKTQKPTWVDEFKNSLYVKSQGWVCYDPWLPLAEQIPVLEALPKLPVSKIAEANAKLFKLNPNVLESTPATIAELIQCDAGTLSSQIIFKDMFVLIRSNILLVDLNSPSAGSGQEVLYAHMVDIPMLGIAFKSKLSPWMQQRMRAVLTPRNADDLVKMIHGAQIGEEKHGNGTGQ